MMAGQNVSFSSQSDARDTLLQSPGIDCKHKRSAVGVPCAVDIQENSTGWHLLQAGQENCQL
jgi:hypothetical protein